MKLSPLRACLILTVLFADILSAAPDVVRREVAQLAAQGKMNEALALVEGEAGNLPPEWKNMFEAKLMLDGKASAQGYTGAAAETAPADMRGEAVFRLGQYQYAAGHHNFAIPQFRRYVANYPQGEWADAASYWMAYSCMQYVQQRTGREAYLDTALSYLDRIEARGPAVYYWPLAHAARARVVLLRGDTAAAKAILAKARARMPTEEVPGALLLSLQIDEGAAEASEWEDALRWQFPLSPETALLEPARSHSPPPAAARPEPSTPAAPATEEPGYSLQLGAFAQRENAERFRGELVGRQLDARIETFEAGERILYRVAVGNYPDPETAAQEGRRILMPLGYEFRVIAP